MATMNYKDIQKRLKQNRQRSYLNRDFESFRTELVQYARSYFSEEITDLSENSMGGLLIEMAAYVGDVMSYYLDHQFNELDILTAVEVQNVEKHVRNAGVKISGAAPATVNVDFYLEVESAIVDGEYTPNTDVLPIVQEGTILLSSSGIKFELGEDLNFAEASAGKLTAEQQIKEVDADGNPKSYTLKVAALCKSGITSSESFIVPDTFTPFRTITLLAENINEIISVKDSSGNNYYEVDSLSQDVVYKRVLNASEDSVYVPENLELLPAPYRFISTMSQRTGLTTMRFGSGDADTLDDDIIPDPSEVALPLFGSKSTFSRFSIDPNSLLRSKTLGVSPRNTTISIRYRYGGGISHNVGPGSITSISILNTLFNESTPASTVTSIRSSLEVSNPERAEGGEAALTLNELRATALAYRNSQSRIVTKNDLLARIYTMPPNFGRVFRVGIRSNPNNPLASQVAILSRDLDGKLMTSSDSLKINLKTYLNDFRLISDAIDIVDGRIANVGIKYKVVIDSVSNKNLALQKVNLVLKDYFKIENFQIDQPIVMGDLINLIINGDGIVSLVSIDVINLTGAVRGNQYSEESLNISANTSNGIVYTDAGTIFEVKYPDDDIVGVAV
jgi:hypothetical protein